MIPPWEFALLALLTFRVWKLIADDKLLDRPRDWLMERVDGKWELFIVCPWCNGFWLAGLTLVGWVLTLGEWPGVFVFIALWFALSAAVGLIAEALKLMVGE